jgi:hypothetical protein
MCIRCSGIHRSLGVHITFVRSVSIDEWKEKQVENMVRWGNKRANEYWEAGVPEDYYIPDENDNVGQMERWIRDKYEKGKFKAKAQPKSISRAIDLTVPIPQVMAQASSSAAAAPPSKAEGGSGKKKEAAAAAAASAAPSASLDPFGGMGGGGGGGGASSLPAQKIKAPAAPAAAAAAADPFDLLGFDAVPVTPRTQAVNAAAAADPFGFSFLSAPSTSAAPAGGQGGASAPAPQPQPASKTADIMALFSSAPPPQQQQQQQYAAASAASALHHQMGPLAGALGGLSLGSSAAPAAVNPFSQMPLPGAHPLAITPAPTVAAPPPQQQQQQKATAADPFAEFSAF